MDTKNASNFFIYLYQFKMFDLFELNFVKNLKKYEIIYVSLYIFIIFI